MTLSVFGLSRVCLGRVILHPTSLELEPGDRVGIVGVSGSGKSTLGGALVDDLRSQGRRVGHVPQSPDEALDPLRSMGFHWREAERALGLKQGTTDHHRLFSALKIEGGDMRQRPWGWSRGMQQRFVIAMALIGFPDLLVLDEPTSALDPIVSAATMDLLDRHLKDSHTAMMLITHNLGLLVRRSKRLLVMHEGRVVEQGATEDILQHPKTVFSRVLVAHRTWMVASC